MGASKSTRHHYSRLILYTILGVYLVFVLFPIIWLVLSSLKTHYQTLMIPPQIVFQHPTG